MANSHKISPDLTILISGGDEPGSNIDRTYKPQSIYSSHSAGFREQTIIPELRSHRKDFKTPSHQPKNTHTNHRPAVTMTSHPKSYLWDSDMPQLLSDDMQLYQQQSLQPFYPFGYEQNAYEPQSENSMPPTPDSSYHDTSLEFPFCHPEDLIDLQRIGTPISDPHEAEFSVDTTGTGANKRIRRREQNRASQRAYRDRQRGKIAELQSKVVALKAQNEKLLARNNMLEAAFQRDKSPAQPAQYSPSSYPNSRRS